MNQLELTLIDWWHSVDNSIKAFICPIDEL
jgi:hypothetical protein